MRQRADGTGSTSYEYVAPGSLGANLLRRVTGPGQNNSLSLAYDSLGRLKERSQDAAVDKESFAYDNLGRVVSASNPLGVFNTSFVGSTNQINRMSLRGGYGIQYSWAGNSLDRQLQVIGVAKAQGVTGAAGRTLVYLADPMGNITRKGELISDGVNVNGTQHAYSYDEANRLKTDATSPLSWANLGSFWSSTVPSATARSYYGLDVADNLTGVNESSLSSTWGMPVNSVNAITQLMQVTPTFSNTAWRYDSLGNVLDDGNRSYQWDAENRLIQVTLKATGEQVLYSYDGLGRRYSRTVLPAGSSATTSTSLLGKVFKAIKGNSVSATQVTRYLWCDEATVCQTRDGNDSPTARYYAQGEIKGTNKSYYHRDHLGSVVDVLDSSGLRQAQLSYTSFGMQSSSQANPGITLPDHRYAGMWWDDKAGLYLTHYRAYDPKVGRWLSRDPKEEIGGFNLYAYASGKPTVFNDPLGLSPLNNLPRQMFCILFPKLCNKAPETDKPDIPGTCDPCSPDYCTCEYNEKIIFCKSHSCRNFLNQWVQSCLLKD